jgi:sec-independent protein translocase protein TatC
VSAGPSETEAESSAVESAPADAPSDPAGPSAAAAGAEPLRRARDRKTRGGERAMPFLEHIEELRSVLLDSLWALLGASVGGWLLADRVLSLLIRPVGKLVFLGPGDALGLKMKVAGVLGPLRAAPEIKLKVWSVVAPGLMRRERSVIGPLVFSSSLLFFGGIAFALAVLAPFTIRFLLSFQTEEIQPLLTANAYFDFLAKMSIAFGIVFQLPIIVGALSWAGVLPPGLLVRRWREAVVLVFIIAAVFTPPDVVSQMMMAAPLLVLYGVSIGVAFALGGKRGRRGEAAAGAEGARAAGGRAADDTRPEEPRT